MMPNPLSLPPKSVASGILNVRKTALPRPLLIGALFVFTALAIYLWSLPFQKEGRLRKASLAELQDMAKREETARVQYYLGLRLREQNQLDAAYTAFGRAAALDPADADSWVAATEAARRIDGEQAAFNLIGNFLKNNPNSAAGHLELVRLYLENRSYQHALEEAKTAVRLDPRNAEVWRLSGTAAAAMETWAPAEADFRHALALAPNDWQNQEGLGDVLTGEKKFAESLPYYREAVRLAPDAAVPALSLGRALMKNDQATQADFAEAEKNLRRSMMLQGNIPVAYLLLGQCLISEKKYTEAKEALLTAQRLDPRAPDAYYELSRVSNRLNDKFAAEKWLLRHQQVLRERNTYGDRKRLLVQKIEQLSDTSAAEKSKSGSLRLQLARLLVSGEEDESAIHQYELLLKNQPQNQSLAREMTQVRQSAGIKALAALPTDQLLSQGDALSARKRFADAVSLYQTALQREPKSSRAAESLGLALQGAGKTEAATYYLLAATALNPNLPHAEFALGTLYQEIGMMTEARKRLNRSLALDPQNAGAWHLLGEILRDRDDAEKEAEDAFEHAVRLEPNNAVYQIDFAEMLATNRKLTEAERSYRRAVQLAPTPESLSQLGAFLLTPPTTPQRQMEAEQLLKRTLNLDPNDDFARFQMGKLALDRGDSVQAVTLLEATLKNGDNTDAKEIWYTLGRAYQKQGDKQKAAAAFAFSKKLETDYVAYIQAQEQVGLHPKDAKRSLILARALVERGLNARAIAEFERCIRLAPGDSTPKRELAALKTRLQKEGKMPDMAVYRAMRAAAPKR